MAAPNPCARQRSLDCDGGAVVARDNSSGVGWGGVQTLWLAALLLLVLPVCAQEAPRLTGYVEPYAAVQVGGDGAFLAGRTRARLDLDGAFDRGAYVVRNEITYDLLGDSLAYDLREAYLDVFFSTVDLRAGRQLLVWGETDGAFITDLLAPLDLSEFLTQPQERLRLGVTALKATAYLGDVTLDGVWIPVSPTTAIPAAGGPWDPLPAEVLGVPLAYAEPERPDARLATSELAARLTWSGLPRTDLALLVHDGTNRVPGFTKHPAFSIPEGLRIEVTPTYRRRTVLGATFETALLDPVVLRGEAAYESQALFDEPVPTSPLALLDSTFAESLERGFLVERPQVQAALTAERIVGTNMFRLTGLGRWILDHDEEVSAEAFQPALTGLWNGTFRRETLTLRAFAYWNIGADLWLSPSLTYALRDALNLEVGVQLFENLDETEDTSPLSGLIQEPSRAFAVYDANDLLYARLRYSF
ncbi:MAG: hypothetical protein HKN04_05115 [Rhodothermaceae bacterium]|nr:hypothetical protein [Rhodothermaceae bacterium]